MTWDTGRKPRERGGRERGGERGGDGEERGRQRRCSNAGLETAEASTAARHAARERGDS